MAWKITGGHAIDLDDGTLLKTYAHFREIPARRKILLDACGMSAETIGPGAVIRDVKYERELSATGSEPTEYQAIKIPDDAHVALIDGGKIVAYKSDKNSGVRKGRGAEIEAMDFSVFDEVGEGVEIMTDRTVFTPVETTFGGKVKITAGTVIITGSTEGISDLTIGSSEEILSPVATGEYIGKRRITTGGYIGIRTSELREVAESTTVIVRGLGATLKAGVVKGEIRIISDDIKRGRGASIKIGRLESGARLYITPSERYDIELLIGEISAGAFINGHEITQPEADTFNALGRETVWLPNPREANILGIERVRPPAEAEGFDVVRGTGRVNAPDREENNPLGAERYDLGIPRSAVHATRKSMNFGVAGNQRSVKKMNPEAIRIGEPSRPDAFSNPR